MKLFSKKKPVEEKNYDLPPLKFPEMHKEEDTFSSIKQNVSKSEETLFSQPDLSEKPLMHSTPEPSIHEHSSAPTMFVKVVHYKAALSKMKNIREKLAEAQSVLSKLDEIKRREEQELMIWHHDLEAIKTKLMDIDDKMFGGK